MSSNELIDFAAVDFSPASAKPLLATPLKDDVDLADWASQNVEYLDERLDQHAAILFRGFATKTEDEYNRFIDAVYPERFEYLYQSTPRTHLGNRIYTTTEYPANYKIPLHIENAYHRTWPMRLCLFCAVQPGEGGETPLASTLGVTERIPEAIREKFGKTGVMYVRNYHPNVDIPWQKVFQSDSKKGVEEYCAKHGIEYEWRGEESLRTRQVCQGLAKHPRTGQLLWCNQANLFHVSGLEPKIREAMLACFSEEDLPRNAYYGDGSPIEADTLDAIRAAYDGEEIAIPWEQGDIALVDNMLVHHARNPYKGERRILITMGGVFPGPAYPADAAWPSASPA